MDSQSPNRTVQSGNPQVRYIARNARRCSAVAMRRPRPWSSTTPSVVDDDRDDHPVTGDPAHRFGWDRLPVERLTHRVLMRAVGERGGVDQHRHLGRAPLTGAGPVMAATKASARSWSKRPGFGVGLGPFGGDGGVQRRRRCGRRLPGPRRGGCGTARSAGRSNGAGTVAGGSAPAAATRHRQTGGGRGHGHGVRTSRPTTPPPCPPTRRPAPPTAHARRRSTCPATRATASTCPAATVPAASASCSSGMSAHT